MLESCSAGSVLATLPLAAQCRRDTHQIDTTSKATRTTTLAPTATPIASYLGTTVRPTPSLLHMSRTQCNTGTRRTPQWRSTAPSCRRCKSRSLRQNTGHLPRQRSRQSRGSPHKTRTQCRSRMCCSNSHPNTSSHHCRPRETHLCRTLAKAASHTSSRAQQQTQSINSTVWRRTVIGQPSSYCLKPLCRASVCRDAASIPRPCS